uniref:Uncharacterized protein n=1 Tax=Rhipicephalus pulchellus TaxID=72859 RepID=L7LZA7_RHIPC
MAFPVCLFFLSLPLSFLYLSCIGFFLFPPFSISFSFALFVSFYFPFLSYSIYCFLFLSISFSLCFFLCISTFLSVFLLINAKHFLSVCKTFLIYLSNLILSI